MVGSKSKINDSNGKYSTSRLLTVMLPSPGTKRTRATEFYDGLCLYIQLVPKSFPPST